MVITKFKIYDPVNDPCSADTDCEAEYIENCKEAMTPEISTS
jgi:hypothetical protein